MSNQPSYSRTYPSAGVTEAAHNEALIAIGRLREMADEYAGTEVGTVYQQQWETAVLETGGDLTCPHCQANPAVIVLNANNEYRCQFCDDTPVEDALVDENLEDNWTM